MTATAADVCEAERMLADVNAAPQGEGSPMCTALLAMIVVSIIGAWVMMVEILR